MLKTYFVWQVLSTLNCDLGLLKILWYIIWFKWLLYSKINKNLKQNLLLLYKCVSLIKYESAAVLVAMMAAYEYTDSYDVNDLLALQIKSIELIP